MKKFEYILFDVAGTLLFKPSFYLKFQNTLESFGHLVTLDELKYKHKLLSEAIHFPDRTNETFYKKFNGELLMIMGIVPEDDLLEQIFNSCKYLPWEKFIDVSVLDQIDLPKGILSNFNTTLKSKLTDQFGDIFKDILVSEELGVAKPNLDFYAKAIEVIGVDPDKILYIGDSMKLDVMPAIQAGMIPKLIDRDNFYGDSKYRIETLSEIQSLLKNE